MPLYDFVCDDGHAWEAIRPSDVRLIDCIACKGKPARRLIPSRFGIVGPTTDTRNMFRRYQEATAEMDAAASKIEASTGQPVETPSLWKQSQQIAKSMIAAGESPIPTQASV